MPARRARRIALTFEDFKALRYMLIADIWAEGVGYVAGFLA